MNARKKIDTWNAGMKDHLEVLGEVTSRGADFEAFRKFMEIRVAHWDALWEECTKPRWARLRMNLHCGKQRAFANFFNQLSALKRNESQRLVVAYEAGRWKTQKGTTPAPTTRTYKECARRFVTIPVDEFRTSYTHHELGCTLQRVEMERCQRSPEDIAKYGPLKEEQMERMAKVRGLLALGSTINGKKRMEFVSRDFNAAINVTICAVMERRPPELKRENFTGQSLKVELYERKLEAVVAGPPSKAGRHLHIRWRLLVQGEFLATTVHCRQQRFSFGSCVSSFWHWNGVHSRRLRTRRTFVIPLEHPVGAHKALSCSIFCVQRVQMMHAAVFRYSCLRVTLRSMSTSCLRARKSRQRRSTCSKARAASSYGHHSIHKSASFRCRRRNRMRHPHRIAPGICNRAFPSLLFPWKRISHSDFPHCSNRFPWSMRHCSAR